MNFRTMILADRAGAELAPLNRMSCPALLEVGGRAVIEYTLEDLAESGVREAVLVSADVASLRERLGDGGRWGIALRYLLARPERSPRECLRSCAGEGPMLLVRGDFVRGRSISRFLALAARRDQPAIAGVSRQSDAGLYLIRSDRTGSNVWPSSELESQVIEMGQIGLYPLDSLQNLHAACLAAGRGEIPGMTLPGREFGNGLVTGRLARVVGLSNPQGRVFVGQAAKLGDRVTTAGTVVVGAGALVDEGAHLQDTVVMPGSYVGRNVELKNAIVAGNNLIRIDLSSVTDVSDRFLLSAIRRKRLQSQWESQVDRVAGLLLLLLSAPLWPLALLSSLIDNPRRLIRRHRIFGNRSFEGDRIAFTAWEWNTPVPLLRFLPWLLPVVAGHLRLVGVRPAGAGDCAAPTVPAGLIGPALLDVSPEATDEEIALSETVFQESHGFLDRLRYVAGSLVALFSKKAWRLAR